MKKLFFLAGIVIIVLFQSCEKDDEVCQCYFNFGPGALRYELDSIADISYSVLNANGYRQVLTPRDSIIMEYFIKPPTIIDSMTFAENGFGEYFSHCYYPFYSGNEENYESKIYFEYFIEDEAYHIIPLQYGSMDILDPNEDDHYKTLILGIDDEEIQEHLKKTFRIEGDRLVADFFKVELEQGSYSRTSIYHSFNINDFLNKLEYPEELTVYNYQMIFKKK